VAFLPVPVRSNLSVYFNFLIPFIKFILKRWINQTFAISAADIAAYKFAA
jgi:hypothetical protein